MRASAVGLVRVDDVAAERRQLDTVDDLGRRGARLRELPGDPPDSHHRKRRGVREDRRHLQEDLEPLADRRGGHVVERLDAIARLEEERPSLGYLAERREQRPGLTGEDERRQALQALADGRERVRVGPLRLLRGRVATP